MFTNVVPNRLSLSLRQDRPFSSSRKMGIEKNYCLRPLCDFRVESLWNLVQDFFHSIVTFYLFILFCIKQTETTEMFI